MGARHGAGFFMGERMAGTRHISQIVSFGGEGSGLCVGIVGGGAGGVFSLIHLIEHGRTPLKIHWFAPKPWGMGVAYRTHDLEHLLNVRAGNMGAFQSDPDHFYRWLLSPFGREVCARFSFHAPITQGSYLPRAFYGVYLQDVADKALERARDKGIEVHCHPFFVTDIRCCGGGDLIVHWREGADVRCQLVSHAILATGHFAPRRLGQGAEDPTALEGRYVSDIWAPSPDGWFPNRLGDLPRDGEVMILGTGLTMIDAVLTLKARGYRGRIVSLSRHGFCPLPHADPAPYPPWDWVSAPDRAPKTILGLLRGLRREIQRASHRGQGWQSVLDTMRSVTKTLWGNLNTVEQQRFLRHGFSLWKVHRHRVPQGPFERIMEMERAGELVRLGGKVERITLSKDALEVRYLTRGALRVETRYPHLVLHAMGPSHDLSKGAPSLLESLCSQGLVVPHPLGMGAAVTSEAALHGTAEGRLFSIGTLLIGAFLECTAVPEMRDCAGGIAQAIMRHRW